MGKTFVASSCVFVFGIRHAATGLCLAWLTAVIAVGQTAPSRTPPILGTVKSIAEGTMIVATDAGAETKVTVTTTTRLLRVPPGSKDLSQAEAMTLSEFQPGDRVLVSLRCAGDPPVCEATRVVAMKKSEITEKQAREREQWRTHGTGGLVKSVDAARGIVTIGTVTAAGKKDVEISVGKSTIVRRYAPGSVKFDDAKASSLGEIQPGDQLRARGTRSADGANFTADEIVTGTFLNIAGTVSGVDTSAGIISVMDLATKKTQVVRVSPDTQLKKLPANVAQMIAMRLKGGAGEQPGRVGMGEKAASAQGGEAGGPGQGQSRGNGDFQQLLNRLPAAPLGEFQKGEAVMIVATGAQNGGQPTAITVLGGVETLLEAGTKEQASSILSPWSLSNGGDAAAQ